MRPETLDFKGWMNVHMCGRECSPQPLNMIGGLLCRSLPQALASAR
jgi:hypothetical protein